MSAPPPAVPGRGNDATRMRLYFRASRLPDGGSLLGGCDPYVCVFANPRVDDDAAAVAADPRTMIGAGRSVVLGRSETLRNTTNPAWQSHVEVDFHFEARQEIAFIIANDTGKGPDRDPVLANGTFLLSRVVASQRSTLTVELSTRGTLTITAEETTLRARDKVWISFRGAGLKKMELLGLCDPYYKLYRLLPNGERKLLVQSKSISETLDPDWGFGPALAYTDLTVAGDDTNRCLQFECWDDNFFKDDKMGQFVCSLSDLRDVASEPEEGVLHPPRDAGLSFRLRHLTKPKEYGDIHVSRVHISHTPAFTEMLAAGLEINLAVSVDFTGSNGDPSHPRSLHHISRSMPNQYERAIRAVGEILMEYDDDKMVPAFGFGAQLPNQATVSHCFHLNGSADPFVRDVEGIMTAYRNTLTSVRLAGPTNFAPSIRQATAAARASPGVYTILLILTDGCITDTDATIDAIVDAGMLPLSIIIVGVGNADFSLMEVLDGDDVRLTNRRGHRAERDLVQFVPFSQFARSPRWELAAEVLQEVPTQVEEWAQLNRIDPASFTRPVPAAERPSPPLARPKRSPPTAPERPSALRLSRTRAE
jgi:copine 1/2/3